jgi:hypothetical protein
VICALNQNKPTVLELSDRIRIHCRCHKALIYAGIVDTRKVRHRNHDIVIAARDSSLIKAPFDDTTRSTNSILNSVRLLNCEVSICSLATMYEQQITCCIARRRGENDSRKSMPKSIKRDS